MTTGEKSADLPRPPASAAAVNPSALTVEEAAALLHVEAATVRRHVEAGLPADEQGRIHLIEYVAWMVRRLGEK